IGACRAAISPRGIFGRRRKGLKGREFAARPRIRAARGKCGESGSASAQWRRGNPAKIFIPLGKIHLRAHL
ncbi:MAG: hypothetical protein ABH832_04680, partial [bacterium]